MHRLLTQLKERRIWRVLIAYPSVVFVLLQAVEFFINNYDLDGRYLRNGANPITGESEHWFFGDGMVHGVRIAGGKAEWYRNRFVQTPNVTDPDGGAATLHRVVRTRRRYDVSAGTIRYVVPGNGGGAGTGGGHRFLLRQRRRW